jgi:hypothetical protein
MKYLLIFIDALRPNMLKLYDNSMLETSLDKTLKHLGGTIFTKCYTPSPDTARSTACLWSSKYPMANGCNTRVKWANFFMKSPECTFFYLLYQHGYSFNIFAGGREFTDSIPPFFDDEHKKSGGMTLSEWMLNVKNAGQVTDNSMTYIYLADFHMRLDVIGYNKRNASKALNFVNELVQTIDNILDIHSFDYVIMFSDHGCLLKEDGRLSKSNLLINGRIQTYLQVINNSKNDNKQMYSVDSKLRSIMDIYPTVLDFANIDYPKNIDGKNLFSDIGHDHILLEDHLNFSIDVGISPKIWGVVDKEGIHVIEYDGVWKSMSMDKEKLIFYKKELEEKMSFFSDYQKQFYIIEQYNKLRVGLRISSYSDGQKRKTLSYIIMNIILILKKIVKNIMPFFLVKKLGLTT